MGFLPHYIIHNNGPHLNTQTVNPNAVNLNVIPAPVKKQPASYHPNLSLVHKPTDLYSLHTHRFFSKKSHTHTPRFPARNFSESTADPATNPSEMADNVAGEHEPKHETEQSFVESVKEKITETFHNEDSSSSESDADDKKSSTVEDVKSKVYRLFGRERPIHKVLGGGKPADIFLWKDKKVSGGVLGFVTLIWVLFELAEYHLLTLVCHTLILALAVLFLWSNAASFINKSPPKFPEVALPEDIVLGVVNALRIEINRALEILRSIASGKDLKKFLGVIAGLWVVSILGDCCNFLTLFYTCFVLLHTVPYLYDKYEDKVDDLAEKAEAEIKKQYAVFSVKVLSKIPVGALKAKFA